MAASAASVWALGGSNSSAHQQALTRSSAHGPRASTSISPLLAGSEEDGGGSDDRGMELSQGRGSNACEHRLAAVGIRRRKHWGWGYEDQQPAGAVQATAAQL